MKKMILTLVALLSMTAMTAQTTQENGPKKMSHEEMTTQMTTQLKLDDAQKAKVAALNKEYQDYLMPQPPQKPSGDKQAKGKPSSDKQAKSTSDGQQTKSKPSKKGNSQQTRPQKPGNMQGGNSQNQAKRQEYEKKLKEILSDDQYKSYQQMGPQQMGPQQKGKKARGSKKSAKTTAE